MKITGIYRLLNKINNKFYIGSSSDIEKRFSSHKRLLRLNKHHSIYLQRVWNKYHEHSFIFEIIEECKENELLEKEQYYLEKLNPHYNISLNSSAPMKGRKHSNKSLEKMSGKIPWNKGIPRTNEEKRKISVSRKGIKLTEEHKEKLRNQIGYWRDKEVPRHVIQNLINYGKLIRTKIICLDTGQIYSSQIEASRDLNIKQGHISEVCSGKRDNAGGISLKNYE